jgi:hypothetical protein
MHKTDNENENSRVIYLLIVVFVILFIIIIIILVVYNLTYDNSSQSEHCKDPLLNSNIGSLSYNKKTSTIDIILPDENHELNYINNLCCNYGYYGKNCEYQYHNNDYYNIGNLDSEYKSLLIDSSSLSFIMSKNDGSLDKTSATYICTHTAGCSGVEYNHKTKEAKLIMNDVKAKGLSNFDFNLDKQIYLRNKVKPIITDIVFGLPKGISLRYYLNSNLTGINIFPLNQLVEVNNIPFKIINNTGSIGFYYTNENSVNPVYKDSGTGEYMLPSSLHTYPKLWVIYRK